jgi:hypothetical protein
VRGAQGAEQARAAGSGGSATRAAGARSPVAAPGAAQPRARARRAACAPDSVCGGFWSRARRVQRPRGSLRARRTSIRHLDRRSISAFLSPAGVSPRARNAWRSSVRCFVHAGAHSGGRKRNSGAQAGAISAPRTHAKGPCAARTRSSARGARVAPRQPHAAARPAPAPTACHNNDSNPLFPHCAARFAALPRRDARRAAPPRGKPAWPRASAARGWRRRHARTRQHHGRHFRIDDRQLFAAGRKGLGILRGEVVQLPVVDGVRVAAAVLRHGGGEARDTGLAPSLCRSRRAQ